MRPAPRLMLITVPGPDLLARTEAALTHADGRVCVQLRDKAASHHELAEVARQLLGPVRRRGAALVINGQLEVAREVRADGVHLPESGGSVAEARTRLGPGAWVGRSCHDTRGLRIAHDASYVTLSPVRLVPGKATPLGLDGFAERRNAAGSTPVLALGGIDAELVPALRDRGAYGVAVRRAVYDADDPAAAVAGLLAAL